jgi:hypothetical protein
MPGSLDRARRAFERVVDSCLVQPLPARRTAAKSPF